MRALTVACTLLAFGCESNGARLNQSKDAAPQAKAVVPGVCLNTDCDHAPEPLPIDIGPVVTCEPRAGDLSIVWMAHIGPVECPLGACVAAASELATGRDGSVWVRSAIAPPGIDPTQPGPVGTALSRFDPEGKMAFTVVIDARTRLAGDAPGVAGMHVGSNGDLLLIAPMPGRPGVELREYDPTGKVVSSRPLVDLARYGHAVIDDGGALTLTYQYEPGNPEDGGSKDPLLAVQAVDVARFDGYGVPIWNQTVSALLWHDHDGNHDVATSARTTTIAHLIPPELRPASAVAAALDENGTATWVRSSDDTTFDALVGGHDGFSAAAIQKTFPPNQAKYFTRLGEDGLSVWSNEFGAQSSVGREAPVATDSQDRTWLQNRTFGAAGLDAISADGTACTSWVLDANVCMTTASGEDICLDVALQPLENGNLFFGGIDQVGLAHLGGLP